MILSFLHEAHFTLIGTTSAMPSLFMRSASVCTESGTTADKNRPQ